VLDFVSSVVNCE